MEEPWALCAGHKEVVRHMHACTKLLPPSQGPLVCTRRSYHLFQLCVQIKHLIYQEGFCLSCIRYLCQRQAILVLQIIEKALCTAAACSKAVCSLLGQCRYCMETCGSFWMHYIAWHLCSTTAAGCKLNQGICTLCPCGYLQVPTMSL